MRVFEQLSMIDWHRVVTDRHAHAWPRTRLSYCVVIRAKSVSDAFNRQTAAADAANTDRRDIDDYLVMRELASLMDGDRM